MRTEWWTPAAPRQLEAGPEAFHGGVPRGTDPSAARHPERFPLATDDQPVRPLIDGQTALPHARVRHGGDDPRQRRPRRRGATGHRMPADPNERWPLARAVNDAVMQWQPGRGSDFPDLNELERRAYRADRVLLPALLRPAHLQQRVVLPIRPLGPEQTLGNLVAHPLSERPTRQTQPTRPLAPDDPAGLRSRPRTSRTCPDSKKACTPRDSTSCGCRRNRGADLELRACRGGFLAGLPYERLLPALHEINVNPLERPIVELDL